MVFIFVVKNAIKNIGRNRRKYVLFGVLYLLLIIILITMLKVFFFARESHAAYRREFFGALDMGWGHPSLAIHDMYFPALYEARSQKDRYLEIKEIAYVYDVRFFSFTFQTFISHSERSPYNPDSFMEIRTARFTQDEIRLIRDGVDTEMAELGSNLNIHGIDLSLQHLEEFELELYACSPGQDYGRMFENDNEAVVFWGSCAHIPFWPNDLRLGDTIIFELEGLYQEYTIVGFVRPPSATSWSSNRMGYIHLFTTLDSAERFNIFPAQIGRRAGYDAIVFLNNPEDFQAFRREVFETFRDRGWWATPFSRLGYSTTTVGSFIYTVQGWSALVAILISLFTILLMTISSAILTSRRKYEFAVLRSMGMSKGNIVLSNIVEKIVLMWGLFVLAFLVAGTLFYIFILPYLSASSPIQVELSLALIASRSLLLAFAGTTAFVGLSLIISSIYILRFEPLKIFNRQD